MFKELSNTISKVLVKICIYLVVISLVLDFLKNFVAGIPLFIRFLINVFLITGFIGIKLECCDFKFCFRKNPAIVIGREKSEKNKKVQNA